MNLLDLEQAIIDRLQALVPDVNISELPLDPAMIGEPVSGTQIWVAFREESFEAPAKSGVSKPIKPPGQDRRITFELITRSQELRLKGHQRIYPILDKVRDSLTGWMPEDFRNTRPFYPVRAGFTSMGAGLWVYSQTFACEAIYNAPTRI